jgi:transcriptional regulator with XRE-family HTH domain
VSEKRWIHADVVDALIRRRGVSVSALAEVAGMNRTSISRFRNGTRSVATWDTAARLAEALGVTVDVISSDADAVVVMSRSVVRRVVECAS